MLKNSKKSLSFPIFFSVGCVSSSDSTHQLVDQPVLQSVSAGNGQDPRQTDSVFKTPTFFAPPPPPPPPAAPTSTAALFSPPTAPASAAPTGFGLNISTPANDKEREEPSAVTTAETEKMRAGTRMTLLAKRKARLQELVDQRILTTERAAELLEAERQQDIIPDWGDLDPYVMDSLGRVMARTNRYTTSCRDLDNLTMDDFDIIGESTNKEVIKLIAFRLDEW